MVEMAFEKPTTLNRLDSWIGTHLVKTVDLPKQALKKQGLANCSAGCGEPQPPAKVLKQEKPQSFHLGTGRKLDGQGREYGKRGCGVGPS